MKKPSFRFAISLLAIFVIAASCATAPEEQPEEPVVSEPSAEVEPAPAAEPVAEDPEPVAEPEVVEETVAVPATNARMEIQEIFAALEAYPNVDVTITAVGVDIAISRAFAANSIAVDELLAEQLDLVGQLLSIGTLESIIIEGHVAEVGNRADSLPISQGRADNVATYLVSNYAISLSSIETIGRGGDFPIADNSSPIGRAQNRRVVILISGSIS